MKRICTLILLSAVAAVALAEPAQLDLADLKKKLADKDYKVRKAAVKVLLYAGQERRLNKEEIELLLPPFKSDPDWRIKVRIALVFPFAADKAQILQPLIQALQERDDDASGGGNLQISSCRALAEVGNQTALPAMREWLTFLKSNPQQFTLLRDDLIKQTTQRIKELEDKAKDQGSNKASEAIGTNVPQPQR